MPASHALTSVGVFSLVWGQGWDSTRNDTKTSHPQITMVSDPHMWVENKITVIINAFERDALHAPFKRPNFLHIYIYINISMSSKG